MIFGGAEVEPSPDVISMRIQPDEGIAVRFNAKVPGAGTQIRPVRMEFSYGSAFGEAGPDAGVLRPGAVVAVRGVGRLYNGLYLLTRVTHRVSDDGYTQSFTAVRNAATMTGAEPYVELP